jgi:endonuclease/exonuclease/phosphatase family metal-dependent hydrolase
MPGGAGESNFLHVKLPAAGMEVVGLRAPAYETSAELKAYWEQLAALVRSTFERRIVWIGDLNADPDTPSRIGGRHLAELERQGWQLPRPSGPWSFVKGTRIDHVLLSPSVPFVSAEYVTSIGGLDVASNDRAARVSDHAALMAVIAP